MEDLKPGWRATSKLLEYLRQSGERINWKRTCSGCYSEKDYLGKADQNFPSTKYKASLLNGGIELTHLINWKESWNSFSQSFSEKIDIGLIPHPSGFVMNSIVSHEPLPYFHAMYGCNALLWEASTALEDFIENGENLIPFWDNMSFEAVTEYKKLIDQLRLHKNDRIIGVT